MRSTDILDALDKPRTLAQLRKKVGGSKKEIKKALRDLESAGKITREKSGKTVKYAAKRKKTVKKKPRLLINLALFLLVLVIMGVLGEGAMRVYHGVTDTPVGATEEERPSWAHWSTRARSIARCASSWGWC